MKKHIKRQILRIRIYLILDAFKRTKYIIKHNIFYSVGTNFFFQPRKIPSEPKLIKFGNNVSVASDVTFITHDIAHQVLNNLNLGWFQYNSGAIMIGDNVFIGSNTTILQNIKIGNNVIIGAGSVVTKNIEDNTVVVGNPARKIASFDEYIEKRKEINPILTNGNDIEKIWNNFYEKNK